MRAELDEMKVLIITNFTNCLPIRRIFSVTFPTPITRTNILLKTNTTSNPTRTSSRTFLFSIPHPPHKIQALTPIICINLLLKTNTTSNPFLEYLAHAIRSLTSYFIARTPKW
jgi:hypothetical protein